ncbi:hypothetical protein [Methylobacterium sp. JK268]
MDVLIASLWPFCAAALLVGGAVGWFAGRPTGRGARVSALALALLTAAAVGAAASGLVPGRAGLWVEIAALLLVPYAAGCALGALPRARSA